MGSEDTLEQLLQQVEALVYRLSRGDAAESDFDEVTAQLRRAALERQDEEAWETTLTATETVGANLRGLRTKADWTQDQVATAMTGVGFGWSRVTVAQVEGGGRRRASFEELFGLAALFGMPVAHFLMPNGHGLDLTESRELSGNDACELVLGRGGQLGAGGARWRPAARVCADVTDRPAAALIRNTQGEHQ